MTDTTTPSERLPVPCYGDGHDHWLPGVLSDVQIKHLVEKHNMISPFEPKAVRENAKGERILSYGLGSYGYDFRVQPKWKVFTPTGRNHVVDPKKMDMHAFVEVEDDQVVIPPNGFVLAVSVEHFDIPPDVICIVFTKSSYARCFAGDTRVALVDGDSPTLERMASEGRRRFGYGIDPETSDLRLAALDGARFVDRSPLVEVEIDNGRKIRCTPDHNFLARGGDYVAAEDLVSGDRLTPLYRYPVRGYEMVFSPFQRGGCALFGTHRLADTWNVLHGVYSGDETGFHRHHKDTNKRNNSPDNIKRKPAGDHIREHNDEMYGDGFDSKKHGEAVKKAIAELMKDPEFRAATVAGNKARALAFWNDPSYAEKRAALMAVRATTWSDPALREAQGQRSREMHTANPSLGKAAGERTKQRWRDADPDFVAKETERLRSINQRHDITEESVRQALAEAGTLRGAAKILNYDRHAICLRFKNVVEEFKKTPSVKPNHRVVAVRAVKGLHDVFCLTSETGNFALEDGVFVENCGVAMQLTPLEPQWKGYITVEIGNTTPHGARVYANEGVGQVLFLRGSQPCLKTYANKNEGGAAGKYQAQPSEIVLPRM